MTLTEPARQVPLYGEYDVVVLGGGPAGILAAASAARNGASVLLVERYGFLGGMRLVEHFVQQPFGALPFGIRNRHSDSPSGVAPGPRTGPPTADPSATA